MTDIKKIVLAYSGGLDTSVAIRWVKEKYGCEVVAYCCDVGQEEDLAAAKAKALAFGASECRVDDRRELFVRDFVYPAFRGAAVYEGEYLLGTSLARPCITEGMMDYVREVGADAICHGATGKGNDQVRFELAAYHFNPAIKVVAPWREWSFQGRQELIEYTKTHNIPIEATADKPYSVDRNLLHTSYEGGVLEDPWNAPDESMFQKTKSPQNAPNTPEIVEIEMREGNPFSLNGKTLGPIEMLTALNELGGRHGIGRVDIVENRFVGMKSRGIYETPGGTLLVSARRAVEQLTLDREVLRLRDDMVPRYASMLYNGFWFAPEREALQGLLDEIAKQVTGTVRLQLYKGGVQILGRKAEKSLYRPDIATFEADEVYDQRDAQGFIRLNALRLRIRSEI